MIWALLVAKALVAYLLGSLSGSLLLGRFRGVDIRQLGSGNAGGTNAFRTQGWKFALGVVLIDVGKGVLGAALGWCPPTIEGLAPVVQGLVCAYACALGHIYPVFFGFRGGKGAAVLVGAVGVLMIGAVPPLFVAWVLVLISTGYVGLSTVVAGLLLPPLAWWLADDATRWPMLAFALAVAVLIVFTHRLNLRRLWRGEELRFERARVFARWFGARGARP